MVLVSEWFRSPLKRSLCSCCPLGFARLLQTYRNRRRVGCEGHQTDKRERLCRYIARPAVAIPRLSLSSTGKVVYTLPQGIPFPLKQSIDMTERDIGHVPRNGTYSIELRLHAGLLARNHPAVRIGCMFA